MSAEPDHSHSHPHHKVKLDKYVRHPLTNNEAVLTSSSDPSGAEKREVSPTKHDEAMIDDIDTDKKQENETATAILKKKKKPNSLM